MKKGIWFIVVLFILFAGCIGSPPKIENPISSAPGMIMDYDKDANTTKIWVKGEVTDYKYSRITITIDETDKVEDNNTYCLTHSTNLPSFSVQIVVWTEENSYEYACSVTIHDPAYGYPRFDVVDDEKTYQVFEKDLPFKRVLEEVKK
ncbi:MAG: hypothetical protein QMC80_03040 [Thermoplasmatales archaeon]|nr:hypothetical protein [Thermoplasmatales archaeon]